MNRSPLNHSPANRAPTLAAAIIALDEARHLAELLPRLDWVDQIVLVDGGSRDATRSVARAHGCRVVTRPFDTFARQRNAALRLAQTDWVLSIDADERPTPALAAEIRRRIATRRWSAFRLPIRSWIFGRRFRRSGTQDDLPVRLFRRHAARWTGDVHEVLEVRGRTSRLDHWLEHHTLENLEAFRTKMHRYTTLAAQARVAAGIPPRWHAQWVTPIRETARRLLWKQGILDGPAGWKFCFLSGISEWVLARRHRQLWHC
jgi:glycosyltransferase involved in cell wall biosynthesis